MPRYIYHEAGVNTSSGGGPSVPGVVSTMEFGFPVPSTEWIVNHGLGRYPTFMVIGTDNTVIMADSEYLSNNSIMIRFSAPTAGKVYLEK